MTERRNSSVTEDTEESEDELKQELLKNVVVKPPSHFEW